jgi:hypothetical protein
MTATQNKRGLDVDQLILDLHQKGFTNADIKQTVHVGGKRIKEVLQGTHVPKKAGRPKKYTEDIEIFIESQFLQDARVTDQRIQSLGFSASAWFCRDGHQIRQI